MKRIVPSNGSKQWAKSSVNRSKKTVESNQARRRPNQPARTKSSPTDDSISEGRERATDAEKRGTALRPPLSHQIKELSPLASISKGGRPAAENFPTQCSSDEANEAAHLLGKMNNGKPMSGVNPAKMAEHLFRIQRDIRGAVVDAIVGLEIGRGDNTTHRLLELMSETPGKHWPETVKDWKKIFPRHLGFSAYLVLRDIHSETIENDADRKVFFQQIKQIATPLQSQHPAHPEIAHSMAVSLLQSFDVSDRPRAVRLIQEHPSLYSQKKHLDKLPVSERLEAAKMFNVLHGHSIIGELCIELRPPSSRLDLAENILGLARYGESGGWYDVTRDCVIPTVERVAAMSESSQRHASQVAEDLMRNPDIDRSEVMKIFHRDEGAWDADAAILKATGTLPYSRVVEPTEALLGYWLEQAESVQPGARAHAAWIQQKLEDIPGLTFGQKNALFQLNRSEWDTAADALKSGTPPPYVVIPPATTPPFRKIRQN